MIVEGHYPFPASAERVWELLLDPDVMMKAMPGARALVLVSEDRYEGVIRVGVGSITAAEFSLSVTLRDKEPPHRYGMMVDSRGRFGFTRGEAHVELVAQEDGTVMRYRADLQVGGKIAAVGQRLLDSVSKLMTRQGLEALSGELLRRLAEPGAEGRGEPAPAPAVAPPLPPPSPPPVPEAAPPPAPATSSIEASAPPAGAPSQPEAQAPPSEESTAPPRVSPPPPEDAP